MRFGRLFSLEYPCRRSAEELQGNRDGKGFPRTIPLYSLFRARVDEFLFCNLVSVGETIDHPEGPTEVVAIHRALRCIGFSVGTNVNGFTIVVLPKRLRSWASLVLSRFSS